MKREGRLLSKFEKTFKKNKLEIIENNLSNTSYLPISTGKFRINMQMIWNVGKNNGKIYIRCAIFF